MFRASLLLVIRKISSVQTVGGVVMARPSSCWQEWDGTSFLVLFIMEYWSVVRWDMANCVCCRSAGTGGCTRFCIYLKKCLDMGNHWIISGSV